MHEILATSEITMCFVSIALRALVANSISWSMPDKLVIVVARWYPPRVSKMGQETARAWLKVSDCLVRIGAAMKSQSSASSAH